MGSIRTAVTRRFWDAHSRGWDAMRAEPSAQAYVAATLDRLAGVLKPGGTVVDLGCGPGHHTAALADRGFAVTGVDYAPAMLALAAAKNPAATYLQADLDDPTSLPAGPFDGALCISVIQVIADPSALLRRVHDILSPGGYLLIEVASRPGSLSIDTMLGGRDRAINRLKRAAARVPGALPRYDTGRVVQLVGGCGFTPVDSPSEGVTVGVLARR